MKKTTVIYGSTTGTCEGFAQSIASLLGADAVEVSSLTEELISQSEVLILGTSTWGCGDLQDDWYDGVEMLKGADLSGKIVALFGCGDGDSYPDTFCDGIGLIYNEIKDSGCSFVGSVETAGYTYDASAAEIDGVFVGLPLDDMNESDQSEDRINAWVESFKAQL